MDLDLNRPSGIGLEIGTLICETLRVAMVLAKVFGEAVCGSVGVEGLPLQRILITNFVGFWESPTLFKRFKGCEPHIPLLPLPRVQLLLAHQ